MKSLSIIAFLLICFFSRSQLFVQNQVMAASGNQFTVGNTSIQFTLGETFTSTLSSGSTAVLTQGFHQPMRKQVFILENNLSTQDLDEFQMNVYPNPFNDFFTIEVPDVPDLNVQIVDLLGRDIQQFELSELVNQIDMSSLSIGNYQLIILSGTDVIQNLEIIKSN